MDLASGSSRSSRTRQLMIPDPAFVIFCTYLIPKSETFDVLRV